MHRIVILMEVHQFLSSTKVLKFDAVCANIQKRMAYFCTEWSINLNLKKLKLLNWIFDRFQNFYCVFSATISNNNCVED